HFDDDVDWRAAALGRREPPLANRLRGAVVEPRAEALEHFDVAHRSVAPHDDLEHHFAGDAAPPRLFGVVGLHLAQQARRIDAAARPIRPAADAAARSGPDAGAGFFCKRPPPPPPPPGPGVATKTRRI